MSSKILIVNQNSGYLTIDVANAFAQEYEEVVVMYGLNRVTERTFHPKIKIQKTIAYNRTSTFKRLLTWGFCSLHLTFLLAWKYRGYKVLYYTNPPMSYFNALLFTNPFSIVVFDTYPDALKLIGIRESAIVYRIWTFINKKVFSKAQKIITLSNGMKNQLQQYVAGEKIEVVSIWPASENFKPIPKYENPFLKQHGWQDKFIVLYSGNMGIGHKLEVLIDVAELLKTNERVLFLFIGEGAKKKTLQRLTLEKCLDNVKFLSWQSSSILPFSLASADIAVVAQEPEASHASVPSKTFNYISVGSPLLGIGSRYSDLKNLIVDSRIGFFINVECDNETDLIIKFILDVIDKPSYSRLMSENSFYISKYYCHSLSFNYLF